MWAWRIAEKWSSFKSFTQIVKNSTLTSFHKVRKTGDGVKLCIREDFYFKGSCSEINPNNITPKVWLQLCKRKNWPERCSSHGYTHIHTPSQHNGPVTHCTEMLLYPHIKQILEGKTRGKTLKLFKSTRHPIPLKNSRVSALCRRLTVLYVHPQF